MKRIYIVMLFAALATITYAQTDDKGYQEGAWVLKGVTGLKLPWPTGRQEVRIPLLEMPT